MAHIKRLEINGFKSFANRTELPFDKGINTIIGPNGSGKSNISDALCFVLGRLGSKSLRAAKTSNLIFQGSSLKKPAQEASVELVFDNTDKSFKSSDAAEIALKRIVRRNGLSVYKINDEVKTRQEVLELLGEAGIDPNGFNLVLQGEISHFVKMRPDERRQIIEEISGISVYESRKEKSLREIEKTEQQLKEVGAVLRERTTYLKNLENERKQALRFKELEKLIAQCKATIIKKKIIERENSIVEVNKEVDKNQKFKEKVKQEVEKINSEIIETENRVSEINKFIKQTTGLERETLNEEVTNLNARIAADRARKENFEKKLSDNEIRKKELENTIKEMQLELESLKDASPRVSKQQEEIKKKKLELEKIRDEREKISSIQTEINSLGERIRDKERYLERLKVDSKMLYNDMERLSEGLTLKDIAEGESELEELKANKISNEEEIESIRKKVIALEKNISVIESEISRNNQLKNKIPDSDLCPLCQSNLTKDHRTHVINDANKKISALVSDSEKIKINLIDFDKNIKSLLNERKTIEEEFERKKKELSSIYTIEEKKATMKKIIDNQKEIESELISLRDAQKRFESRLNNREIIEEKYNKLFYELQELSSRTDENLDTNILYKEKEIESIENILRNIQKDKVQLNELTSKITKELSDNENILKKKQKEMVEMSEKFKKLFDERTNIQELIKQKNILVVEKQNIALRFEDSINNHKINLARLNTEKENLEYELNEFNGIELLQGSLESLIERLKKSEQTIATIGNVNLRALEVYDSIKEEYDKVYQKVEQLQKERDEILKVIDEIDKKKRKTFMKTFEAINELFTTNFMELSTKGKALLEIQNPENIFEGGIDISIKVGQGKYFDVTSLSGGEQTLVALSLIFAIQEYKPYAFYILDEIDAALDKRNAGLLANLLKKYILKGQYIIISHNDEIISNADTLYGVSMNNGISKIVSLDVSEGKLQTNVNNNTNPGDDVAPANLEVFSK